MALFISFEGGEGSGKSTQARLLYERLQQFGISSMSTREPGTTSLGRYLRDWLKQQRSNQETISYTAELFLFVAARSEFVAKVLSPALKQKSMVLISDRYADSTTAYQGFGRRIRMADVELVNSLATQGLMPDLTFLLDCSPENGLERVRIKLPLLSAEGGTVGRVDDEGTRRFEEEPFDFHKRVRDGYLKLAEREPSRWCVIDALQSVEEISEVVWGHVEARLTSIVGFDRESHDSSILLKAPQQSVPKP